MDNATEGTTASNDFNKAQLCKPGCSLQNTRDERIVST